MAKISTYNLDSSLNDNDKLIGTDGGTGLTKNFSVRTFINYINQQGNVNIVSSVNGLDGDVVLNTDDIPEGANKYDQEVTITGSGSTTVTGLYPNFNVSSENDTYIAGDNITINNDNVISSSYQDTTYTAGNNISISQDNVISAIDTNTDTTYTAGNGLSLNGTEFSNDFPDRVVTITGSGDTNVTGEYPNFNVYSDGGVKSIVAGDNITIDPISGTGNITISSTGGGGSAISLQEGNGISINNDNPSAPVITNTAPDQTVTITGTGSTTVTGSYPNFSISSTGTEYTAGTGLTLVGTEFQNTSPDQTVTITGSGNAIVTGTYPNFNIDVADGGVGGGGGVIAKDSFVGNGTQMDYQLSATPTSATYTEVFISGVYQEASTYTLSSDVITLSSAPETNDTIEIVTFNLGVADGGESGAVGSVNGQTGVVVLDTDDIAEGTTNLYDKTVAITGTGATTVTGTYPNFNVSSTDTDTVYTAGAGLELTGTVFSNAAPDQEVTITGSGATTVTGNYPSFTVSSTAVNTDDFITNANDTYPSVSKVTDIISLTQAEYDGLTPDENAIYIIVG